MYVYPSVTLLDALRSAQARVRSPVSSFMGCSYSAAVREVKREAEDHVKGAEKIMGADKSGKSEPAPNSTNTKEAIERYRAACRLYESLLEENTLKTIPMAMRPAIQARHEEIKTALNDLVESNTRATQTQTPVRRAPLPPRPTPTADKDRSAQPPPIAMMPCMRKAAEKQQQAQQQSSRERPDQDGPASIERSPSKQSIGRTMSSSDQYVPPHMRASATASSNDKTRSATTTPARQRPSLTSVSGGRTPSQLPETPPPLTRSNERPTPPSASPPAAATPSQSEDRRATGSSIRGRAGIRGRGRGSFGVSRANSSLQKRIAAQLWDDMEQRILNEILDHAPGVRWEGIAGLELVKDTLQEIVIAPSLNPELFSGLRAPARGVLLFGPPGNGKTMIAKAVATECGATFFNISASSITSKWVGESEKQVRALFSVAKKLQPAVIFIDEIDSMLTSRSSGEHEGARRLKTEFLVQIDGAGSSGEDRILVLGATNRPRELDDAMLRRLVKRIYVPLPDRETRRVLVQNLLSGSHHEIAEGTMEELLGLTDGYSGSDLTALCKEAAMVPVRGLPPPQLSSLKPEEVRPITMDDFKDARKMIRPSVSPETLKVFESWNNEYGTKR